MTPHGKTKMIRKSLRSRYPCNGTTQHEETHTLHKICKISGTDLRPPPGTMGVAQMNSIRLFPIQEQGMNSYAYPLSQKEIKIFHKDAEMKQRLLKSYKLMLNFYGIKLVDEKSGKVERSDNWETQSKNLNRNTHNNLRITRILKCLGILGFQHYQAPLVQFFLEESLVNRTLPRVKISALDYFMFAVLNKLERKKLIKFAFMKFEPKEEFVWCPKRIQRKFLHQKTDHEVPGNSESTPRINSQNQTPQSNPTIKAHNQSPQSNPTIKSQNQIPVSVSGINSEIAKTSCPESETQPVHEASGNVSSSRGSEEQADDELQSVTIKHPENVASAIPSEEKLSAQAECDLPTPHAKGDSRCKTAETQTSGSEVTEVDVPVLQPTTAEQSTENKNKDLSGEDSDMSGKGMCNDQPTSEKVEVTAENSSKCNSDSNGGNNDQVNEQPEPNPPVGYQMARREAQKSGADKEGGSVSVPIDCNRPTTAEDGSTQSNITDDRRVPASGYRLSHDNNTYSDQTSVECEKEHDVPDELKEAQKTQHSKSDEVTDSGAESPEDILTTAN
ncbi:uncharacterized protein LOC143506522 isoform X2 [Brachyhypopomus gauderio]|uniref:uncharacterized protein LOC143506522 isoform X2 n=1 Tax=Brachyhypopomus gauderio TaxID=698409 RepID=UPI004041D39A